ncbi:MAG: radical SAM protein [Bacteroidales bacterium]|nr:radical SAM protein [Bacteroidales bacterium]
MTEKHTLKILLANPAYRVDLSDGMEQYFFCAGSRCPWSLIKAKKEYPRYAMFPFMLGYAAALLEEAGFRVEAIDAIPLNLDEHHFLVRALEAQADILFFEPVTTSIKYIAGIAERLKKDTGAKIIFGGSHVTALPGETLAEYPCVDFILRGEYEFALLELVQGLSRGQVPETIPGLSMQKSNGEILINKKAAIENINSLPFPARHLFPSSKVNDLGLYHDGFCQNRPALQMHSSRGCPFRCKFCLWTQLIYQQGQYRVFDAARVVDEMVLLRDSFGAREIYIDDDTFTGNKKHVMEVCRLILERKLNTPWSVMGDAMVSDEEMILAMKKSGCIGIKFGLESANSSVLKEIQKPLDITKLSRLIRLCNRLRIKTHVSVSFGHLNETPETLKETLKFSYRLSSDSIQFSIATPYPGTVFYDEATEKGYLMKTDWSAYDPTHDTIMNLPGISVEELRLAEARSHGRWLRHKLHRPGWIFRQSYFMMYLIKRQGMKGFINRMRRAALILFSKKFR